MYTPLLFPHTRYVPHIIRLDSITRAILDEEYIIQLLIM